MAYRVSTSLILRSVKKRVGTISHNAQGLEQLTRRHQSLGEMQRALHSSTAFPFEKDIQQSQDGAHKCRRLRCGVSAIYGTGAYNCRMEALVWRQPIRLFQERL